MTQRLLVNSYWLGGVCGLHRQGLWSWKREDFLFEIWTRCYEQNS